MEIYKHDQPGDGENSHSNGLENQIEDYKQFAKGKISLSEHEVENALENVLQQVEASEEGGVARSWMNWKTSSIAASIAFLLILTFLSIPKSIRVPNGEIASVTLPDGSSVTLNSGSEIEYSRLFNYTGRNVELYGEGFFQIEHRESDPFTVTTQNSQVKVLGTEFNLEDWNYKNGNLSKVTVTEGKVEYANILGTKSFILEKNDEASIDQNFELKQDTADLRNSMAWLSSNISFQKEPLTHAFEKLERRFNITIDYQEVLSGEANNISAYYNEPYEAESIIQDICTIKGLSFQKTHNGYKISSK